jgi:hypothetical protein
MSDDQGRAPTQFTKWDVFALLSHVAAEFFEVLTAMLETQAEFVEDKKSFHEYAARTIETLNEGE